MDKETTLSELKLIANSHKARFTKVINLTQFCVTFQSKIFHRHPGEKKEHIVHKTGFKAE